MQKLTRRSFLALTTALAGTLAIPKHVLGATLSAPLKPNTDAPTTLRETVKLGPVLRNKYRQLVAGAGEPYMTRTDLVGGKASKVADEQRRSLAYLGHFSDIHLIDAQSPGRLEPLAALTKAMRDATRPQETMTVNVLAQMVEAVRASMTSPVSGAPMLAAINTGDAADSKGGYELDWYIKILDGGDVVPNSGLKGQYQGVQAWEDATYTYQPPFPDLDSYGEYGFPTLPDMLDKVVSQTVSSPGLPCPWYTTYGNHDALFMGNVPVQPSMSAYTTGDRKASTWQAMAPQVLDWWGLGTSSFEQMMLQLHTKFSQSDGLHTVAGDSGRTPFSRTEFMQAHLDSPAKPGPVGHGFTQSNVDNNTTYWEADLTPYLRVFGLDTCNFASGANGSLPKDQFDWLEGRLAETQKQNIFALVTSHHNSMTMNNTAQFASGPQQPLIEGDEFVDMLKKYPNMIAWINGHTHMNTIIAHPRDDGHGFWEITTASCVDFPQQQQVLDFIDNRDGTLSIFATTIDHDSPITWREGDYSQAGFASLSRELSANAMAFDPDVLTGSRLDRNTELLIKAPFDTKSISDATVQTVVAKAQALLIANTKKKEA